MKAPLRLIGLAALALALAMPGTAPALAQDGDTIRIGMTVSSTGRFALQSQSGVRGVEIWVDDVNRRGGIELNGEKRKVELVKLDDRSDKQMVPRVYETLIENENVDLVFGPFGSTLTGAAAQVTERNDKFLVIWSAASDAIYEQGYDSLVSATQIASSLMPIPSVSFANQELGITKLAIIYLDEPFPAGMAEGARDVAEEQGVEVVQYEKFATGTKDFSILIQKAKAAGADGFYPIGYEGDQMTMLQQMKAMNVAFPFTFMLYGSQPQFLDNMGPTSDYIFSHTLYHENINWDVTAGLTRAEMLERYNELFPDVAYPPDFQTALAYSAGVMTERFIEEAQSLEADKLKQAALGLSGKVVTMAGPYELQESGMQTGMQNVIMQNMPEDGPGVMYPAEVKTTDPVFPIPDWDKREGSG
jgi:branched-chain amino acid transport system substrate-binding protein